MKKVIQIIVLLFILCAVGTTASSEGKIDVFSFLQQYQKNFDLMLNKYYSKGDVSVPVICSPMSDDLSTSIYGYRTLICSAGIIQFDDDYNVHSVEFAYTGNEDNTRFDILNDIVVFSALEYTPAETTAMPILYKNGASAYKDTVDAIFDLFQTTLDDKILQALRETNENEERSFYSGNMFNYSVFRFPDKKGIDIIAVSKSE